MSIEDSELRSGIDGGQVARYVAGVAVGVLGLGGLFTPRGDLAASWHQLAHLRWSWAIVSIAAEFTSVLLFAYLQRRVLENVGVPIGLGPLVGISFANNAIALTVPGEPAV